MSGFVYRRKQGVKEQKVGAELMLIDESVDKVHVLNATSAFVWTCLSETSDAARIEQQIRETFDTGAKDVQAVVEKALGQLIEQGILTREASASGL